MSAKSSPVVLGTGNTTIFECPATLSAYAQLFIANVTGSAVTYTLKFFKQSTGVTTTISPATNLAANAPLTPSIAFSLEAGDQIIGLASAATSVVAMPVISLGETTAARGLTPKGEYSAGATYAINDMVSVAADGNSWISIQNGNIGHTPSTNPAWWMLLSERGEAAVVAAAVDVPFAPSGSVGATNVQAGIAEVDAEKVSKLAAGDTVAGPLTMQRASGYDEVALTWAATTIWDVSAAPVATLALAGNTTMGPPTGVLPGRVYTIRIQQNNSFTSTVAWTAANFKFVGGIVPLMTSSFGAVDRYTFVGRPSNVLEEVGRAQGIV